MQRMTKKEILELRAKILTSSEVKSKVKRRDKRISSPSRVCSVCKTQLSGLNYNTGKAIAKKNHWHIQYNKLVYIDICEKAESCYRNIGVNDNESK